MNTEVQLLAGIHEEHSLMGIHKLLILINSEIFVTGIFSKSKVLTLLWF